MRGKALTDTKAQLEPAEAREAVTSWLGQLSEEQTVAVAPLLKALSGLMSEHKGPGEQIENAVPSTPPVTPVAAISTPPLESLEQFLSQAADSGLSAMGVRGERTSFLRRTENLPSSV